MGGGDHVLGGTETLPKAQGKGDVYLLRLILHDWDDAEAVRILAAVHEAIGTSGATLCILDVRAEDRLYFCTPATVLLVPPSHAVRLRVLSGSLRVLYLPWTATLFRSLCRESGATHSARCLCYAKLTWKLA